MIVVQRYLATYGANIAGTFYNIGNAFLFIVGAINYSPREISSAVILVVASCSFGFFGHKRWGVPIGCVLAVAGIFLAALPGLKNLEGGTLYGFGGLVLSAMFGIFSIVLTKRFSKDKRQIVRQTLGTPRRMMGLSALFLSRLPIMLEAILHQRWESAVFFGIVVIGDAAASMSRTA